MSDKPHDTAVDESGESDTGQKDEKQNLPGLKANKSMLYTIISNAKPVEEVPKAGKQEEAQPEGDKKIQKNVSTLYKIISSQSVLVKPLETAAGDDIEYENVLDEQRSDESHSNAAENAVYYVDGEKSEKNPKSGESKPIEVKKSFAEIKITPGGGDQPKMVQLTGENLKICKPTPERSVSKANLDLGDLSTIRFSFLDRGSDDKSSESMYDTIEESKSVGSSGTENLYSSPRISLNCKSLSKENLPESDYITGDPDATANKSDSESELFYAASEVLHLRPSTPFEDGKDGLEYEDMENEKLPEIPQQTGEKDSTDPDEYADVDINDYCRHREENPRNLCLNRKEKKAIVRVRSKINKAWKSMKNWINEEREAPKAADTCRRRTPNVEIRVLRNEAKEPETEPEVVKTSESPLCESPRFCFSKENLQFLDVERRENSDSGTYVDMTRSQMSDSSTDLFTSLTLRRKKRDGSSATPSFRKSRFYPEGQNGFEELRRYIKQGGDFCKELSVILQERSEAETQYAKSLSKLSHKLLKTSKDAVGSVSEAWQRLGAEMETQSELHRTFANALNEEVVKPLKQMIESQHRIRKNVEGVVDKTGKILTEWRQAECKSKKQSFLCARENEKLQDTMLDVRNNRNASTLHLHHHNHKNVSDKESAKLDLKRKKAEESVKKADIEYYSFCVRAERSRLDWESAVTRGSHSFQALEEERLACLKALASCYLKHFKEIGPRLIQSCERLTDPVESCDVTRDIQTVVAMKGSSQPLQEQLLPDFYAEHVTLAMNRERRRQALVKLLHLIKQDLERERRGKEGVENLQRALQQTPTFGAEESQQNVDEKLHHMKSMLIYLEAARYKVQNALAELDGRGKLSHPLSPHIHMTRDRQGLQQSVLRVPYWAKNEAMGEQTGNDSPDWTGREAGDGTSVQPDSDFDEFSSVGSDKDYQCSVYNVPIISDCNGDTEKNDLGQCRALYEYTAKVYDELNLRIGDIIKIHDKHPDGWWLGELDGVVGIFPATYVEEISDMTP